MCFYNLFSLFFYKFSTIPTLGVILAYIEFCDTGSGFFKNMLNFIFLTMAKRGNNLKVSKKDLKARRQEKAARKLEEKKLKGRKLKTK